ncbi:MAG: hypothetical protein OXQ29_27790, partial [Rhodospirillaceae bacterium]|nr:hypothetical protein [Rhodospirillaceae bacterium]
GPARLTVWTYATGKAEFEALWRLYRLEAIQALRFVIDAASLIGHHKAVTDAMAERWGANCIRVTKNHAKMTTLVGGGWHVLIDGSATLAANLRFEQIRISDDPGAVALVEGLADELWAKVGPQDLSTFTSTSARRLVTDVSGVQRERRRSSGVAATNFGPGFLG